MKEIKQASWDENIEHYDVTGTDWAKVGATAFLVGFGLVMLIVIF